MKLFYAIEHIHIGLNVIFKGSVLAVHAPEELPTPNFSHWTNHYKELAP